jgi:riboflavin kinase/FMN adenylyltransferase
VAVDFQTYVRGQATFDSLEALMAQMTQDVDHCRRLLLEQTES